MTPSPPAADLLHAAAGVAPPAGGGADPWQWLFFAALGAWLVGGAVRPTATAAATPECGVPPATDAGRWYLLAVGGVLLACTLAACWSAALGG